MMNTFLDKYKLLGIGVLFLMFAFAKAQTTSIPEAKEYIITSNDDRARLLGMTDMFKSEYDIRTRFKDFRSGKNRLTDLELEFSPLEGGVKMLKTENQNGIEAQSIVINPQTKQILYVGAKSDLPSEIQAKINASLTATAPQKIYVKVADVPMPKVDVPAIPENKESKTPPKTQEIPLIIPTVPEKVEIATKAPESAVKQKEAQKKMSEEREVPATKPAVQNSAPEKVEKSKEAENAKEDERRMKETLKDLKREQQKQAQEDLKIQGTSNVVFINTKAYFYKINQGQTFVLDENERTILVLPTDLSRQPVSGPVSLNRLRYQFSLDNNVITLYNGAGEPVDLQGKPL